MLRRVQSILLSSRPLFFGIHRPAFFSLLSVTYSQTFINQDVLTTPVDRRFRLILGLNILSVLVFLVMVIAYLAGSSFQGMDNWVNDGMSSLENGFLVEVFTLITYIGNVLSLIVMTLIVIVILLFKKRWNQLVVFMPSMLSGWITYPVLKALIQRARPEGPLVEVWGHALPSGHASMSMIMFAGMIYCFRGDIVKRFQRRSFTFYCVALIVLVGFSRIYLSVHWLTDVLAGYGLGLFLLTGFILLFDHLHPWTRIRRKRTE